MLIYVCIHGSQHMCTLLCVCVYIHTLICVYIQYRRTHTRKCTCFVAGNVELTPYDYDSFICNIHTHSYMYIYNIHTHTHIYIQYTHSYVYTHAHIYIQYTHTHTGIYKIYTHSYMYMYNIHTLMHVYKHGL